ncbi:hypothetical protein CCM_04275 [Cordyceps militaris CM01]|uniref:Uncharacterized protein n=1 Tax=Cordyceps militaris (strain CM01) TaxID=983644 RepID=G3JE78_CORMM|nr:uncharacterized protein CCM_04275 [Cordyceps militaris CM01]EGX92903.1 hypothetical protein CCM_04275 [Cordyceps militaris CM01]
MGHSRLRAGNRLRSTYKNYTKEGPMGNRAVLYTILETSDTRRKVTLLDVTTEVGYAFSSGMMASILQSTLPLLNEWSTPWTTFLVMGTATATSARHLVETPLG